MENSELITKAVEYAKTHCRDEISVQDVADHAGFSLDYFNRMFLQHTGFTVMSYISYNRLKNAAVALRNAPDRSVLDIALDAGYDSHEGFTRAFKKQYGMTPTDYRNRYNDAVVSWRDLVDSSVAARFLHDNPDFIPIDVETAIDRLLEKDAIRYGYFCANVKYEGMVVASHDGTIENGFIAIGDDGNNSCYFVIETDDFDQLSNWLARLRGRITFDVLTEPATVRKELEKRGIVLTKLDFKPQSYYFGKPFEVKLPSGIIVRKLEASDKSAIEKWANGKRNGFIAHLMSDNHYSDPNVLDYGIFKDSCMIAAAGCGIDEVNGFKINDCVVIHADDTRLDDDLKLEVYKYITNDIIARDVIPYDDIQHGKFAEENGNFTTEELGFKTVCHRYSLIMSK